MNLLDRRPVRHPRTASRVIDDEAVIVTPEENLVKVLNEVGSRIWELADGTRTVGEIAEAIYIEFEVDKTQAEEDVVKFVEELEKSDMMAVKQG